MTNKIKDILKTHKYLLLSFFSAGSSIRRNRDRREDTAILAVNHF